MVQGGLVFDFSAPCCSTGDILKENGVHSIMVFVKKINSVVVLQDKSRSKA